MLTWSKRRNTWRPRIMKLRNITHGIPDGWRYTEQATGYVVHSGSYIELEDAVRAHLKANNLPIPDNLGQVIQNQLCHWLPPDWCQRDETEMAHYSNIDMRMSVGDIINAAKAYATLALRGFKTVTQEEADRRARICANCFLRVQPQGCGACAKMAEAVIANVAGKTTAYADALYNKACAACKCPIASIVHFPMDILEKAESPNVQNSFPDFCWRKQGGENYHV